MRSDAEWAKYDARREGGKRRRERLEAARKIATHTKLEWEVLKEIFRCTCVMCGNYGTEKDHIVPLFCGGSDGIDNLQPLCARCNSSKTGSEDLRDKVYPRWREHYNKVAALISTRLTDA